MRNMGGKSELHRARRSVTRSPGNGKESATERETALYKGKGEKVSASGGSAVVAEGKSSPVSRATGQLGKPRLEQGQIGSVMRGAPSNPFTGDRTG